MAKYEREIRGDFQDLLDWLHNDITERSPTATYEDGSDHRIGETRLAVRVYERYSMAGSNRVSLNITLMGRGEQLFLSAITSGGSQAVFFKVNIVGEEAFLDLCRTSVEKYIAAKQ
ncbi:MAG TPA: hypothetical protein GX521_09780 [Firmicutes bacterium]|nr:hypothetical protein [Bacillota bacterium]